MDNNKLNYQLRNAIRERLAEMNYDFVMYRDEDNYLVVSKIASILKYYGFTKQEFYIPAKESLIYNDKKLSPIWEIANGQYHDVAYIFLIEDVRLMDEDMKKIIYFDQIEKEEIQWLVPGFIPKGNITIISGDGGVGKGFISCNILKSITSNVPTFFEDQEQYDYDSFIPGKAFYFTSEDSLESVVKERLEQAKLDQRFVATISIKEGIFKDIKYDSPLLEKFIRNTKCKLVIFDPFQSFIDSKVNLSSRGQVREVLSNLVRLGELYGTAFILISHTNKSDKRSGRGRLADTSDLWDIARSVIIVGNTGEDDIRYFSQEKNNYSKIQDTVLYTIKNGETVFVGTTPLKDNYYVQRTIQPEEQTEDNKLQKCLEEIISILRSNNGQIASNTLSELLESQYSAATIKRAKEKLSHNNDIKFHRNQLVEGNKRATVIQLLKDQIN